jgi:hypothetical protein
MPPTIEREKDFAKLKAGDMAIVQVVCGRGLPIDTAHMIFRSQVHRNELVPLSAEAAKFLRESTDVKYRNIAFENGVFLSFREDQLAESAEQKGDVVIVIEVER